jgi:hypothetical protein
MKKLPSINKSSSIVEQLKAGLPPAVVDRPKRLEAEPSFQIQMPSSLLKQLKLSALEQETSVRVIILQALEKAGFKVDEISDRRRTTK